MISEREQKVLADIERLWEIEADEPPHVREYLDRQPAVRPSRLDEMPAAVAGGLWAGLLLVLLGAVPVGLVVGAASWLGWLLWPRTAGPRAAVRQETARRDGEGRRLEEAP